MIEIRLLKLKEYRDICNSSEGLDVLRLIRADHNWRSFWIQNGKRIGYVATVSAASVSKVYDCDHENYIYPVIVNTDAEYAVGSMFTFGKDTSGLPIRWVALSKTILGIYENQEFISSTLKYFTRPVREWGETTPSEPVCAASKVYSRVTKNFSSEDLQALSDKDLFAKRLSVWDGFLEITSDIAEIPKHKYCYDWTLKALRILPRSEENPLRINKSSFYCSDLCSVEGLEYCSFIGKSAFLKCPFNHETQSVTLGNIGRIEEDAFDSCGIKELRFMGAVGTIEKRAFQCNKIENIVFEDNAFILELGDEAFRDNVIPTDVIENTLSKVIVKYATNAFMAQH